MHHSFSRFTNRIRAGRIAARIGPVILAIALAAGRGIAGLTWPAGQFLPTFATPAGTIDCIVMDGLPSVQQTLFVSLEGIVNRTQPQIACVSAASEGEFTWMNIHNLPCDTISGYNAILKYETNVTGLVVYDPALWDTLNLATTIAGVKNELICDPSLLATLTNSPYNLAIKDDLRGMFANKYQVYGYLYTNYWPLSTHRIIAGMETNQPWYLRDYLVAVKSAVVWLDPSMSADSNALKSFTTNMTPVGGVYLGWWPNEGADLNWIGAYGIPVMASDLFDNGSVYGGVVTPIFVPPIPPTPTLQNKVYVSLTLSDGDNVQYMQHTMMQNWASAARGSVPIGWTVQPLLADFDPGMLNYFWSTATTNDCLVAGPSGAGYTHIEYWSSGNVASFTKASNPYLQKTGIRTITVWDTVSATTGNAFATNCPTLVGVNDQSDGYYTAHDGTLPVIGFPSNGNYATNVANLINAITNTAKNWSGSSPMFIAVQARSWGVTPADCQTVANSLDPAKYVVVRPDHLFLLYQKYAGLGGGGAAPYVAAQPAGQSALVGTDVAFNVIATGTGPLSYQWRFNGTNIAGATNSTCTRAGVQASDAGNYTVLVTNVAGSVTSSNAALSISFIATNVPYVMTLPATMINSGAAVLNGVAVANGFSTAAWFEWGTNTSYGHQTAAANAGQGYQPTPIGAALNGLAAGTIYHFRLDATNALGATFGTDCRFTTGGRVQAWGDNGYGQTNVPMGLTNIIDIACGAYHGMALGNNGTVVAWGRNDSGQANVPSGLSNVVAVVAGLTHSLALKADGTVVAWGANFVGQTNLPAGLTNVTAIAAGGNGSLALKTDGTVVGWGWNNYGQTNVPPGLNNVVGMSVGIYHNLVLKSDGTVVVWGDNTFGQTNVPVGLTNAVAIAAGEFHSLALKSDGTVVAWGRNTSGQTNVPAGLANVTAIACGENYSMALQSDGTVVAWGDNTSGQTNVPAGLVDVAQLSGGLGFGVAIANQLPQANGQVASGYVNHDLAIGLSGNSPDGNPLNYRIMMLPSAGALYQFSNGARGNLINATNVSVSNNAGQVIFAPGTNQTGSPCASFNFVANDGQYDSVPGTVAVNIGLPVVPPIGSVNWNAGMSGGRFELDFSGSSNATFSIWGSTNLLDWTWRGTATETVPGQYQFLDLTVTNWPQCFYRLSVP